MVISIDPIPPSIAARHAWKPASASWVRSTPHSRLGKAFSMGSTALSVPGSGETLCWYIRMTEATATAQFTTREQIIQAAADSLLENGYSGTSVRAIASRAGVAIGNLQYWFPTKSELLVEAWRYLTARSVEELREALNQLTDPLEVLEVGVESIWDSLRRLGDIQLAAFDLLVQAPRTERLRAYLPELFTRYREVIQEQLDRLEDGGIIRLTVPREVLVPLVLNTVLGFGLYYVVTRDDESCLRALSAFRTLASTLIEPVP
ncbi:MAG: TetR/AcrR family transcriptional regulator [Chloroflexi bacterium]|nr:MAG: TetR/AcrR family transcriptional regulator [Chloroflexota bacterium]